MTTHPTDSAKLKDCLDRYNNDSTAILFSGGLDSACLAIMFPAAKLVFIETGLPGNQNEYAAIFAVSNALVSAGLRTRLQPGVSQFSASLSGMMLRNAIVPLRNVIFCAYAFNVAPVVLLGATEGDSTGDKTDEFATYMTSVARAAIGNDASKYPAYHKEASGPLSSALTVALPFRCLSKTEIVRQVCRKQLKVNAPNFGFIKKALLATRSCYNETKSGKECGDCRACVRRFAALYNNGFFPTESDVLAQYEQVPLKSHAFKIETSEKNRGQETADIISAAMHWEVNKA